MATFKITVERVDPGATVTQGAPVWDNLTSPYIFPVPTAARCPLHFITTISDTQLLGVFRYLGLMQGGFSTSAIETAILGQIEG
jgi:hypothetical protein